MAGVGGVATSSVPKVVLPFVTNASSARRTSISSVYVHVCMWQVSAAQTRGISNNCPPKCTAHWPTAAHLWAVFEIALGGWGFRIGLWVDWVFDFIYGGGLCEVFLWSFSMMNDFLWTDLGFCVFFGWVMVQLVNMWFNEFWISFIHIL